MDVKEMLCKELCIKYGYSKKESEAYIRGYKEGYQNCKNECNMLNFNSSDESKEYHTYTIPDNK